MTATPPAARLQAVDLARGLVVMIMALDHSRHLFHLGGATTNPLDPDTTSTAVFFTRWITHLCAPVFVWLAGVSAWLRLQASGDDRRGLARFLLSRGLWLIVLEVAVISFAVNFSWRDIALQVIWALGVSMVALSALVFLPRKAVLAVGIAVVAGHNLLDPIQPSDLGAFAPLWTLAHEGGPTPWAFVLYPALPWAGVMTLGFGMAPLFTAEDRDRRFLLLGAASLFAFFVLRGWNLYGDPDPWEARASGMRSLFAALDVQKQPPSLHYVLAMLGLACLLIPALPRLPAAMQGVLSVFGRVPLFFYVLHFFLLHILMVAIGWSQGLPLDVFIDVMSGPARAAEAGWGLGLAEVYGVWLAVMLALYPACRWFGSLKARRKDWWLSYL